jgi:hypothetical protein
MAIIELYSKRQNKLLYGINEVYFYDKIPQPLKVQIVHIIQDTIGRDNRYEHKAEQLYQFIHEIICREYGIFNLGEHNQKDEEQIINYFLQTKNIDEFLDIVELCFKCMELIKKDFQSYTYAVKVKLTPNEAIEELNQRFKEHSVGYQFDGGQIIRIDSTYIHSEITKPSISLLQNSKFAGANEEYLKAHDYYKDGKNKECLTECLKAFESTMKIICKEKGWVYNETDTASKLINVCFEQNLIPSFSQNQFSSLKQLLTTGIPTLRNKLGGHGQGQVPQTVDDGIARYGLNLTGTNIIFLIEQSGL